MRKSFGIGGSVTPSRATMAISIAAATLSVADPLFAQAKTGEAAGGIEEIVVTAQKRSERLQDVPIAITAITSSQITAQHAGSSYDLTAVVPALNFGKVVAFATPYIRGIGTSSVTAGDEPSVATYVDGVYMGSTLTAALPFNNIDQIEVLKGPQGTLYGRNAMGGLISIKTKAPSDVLTGSGSVTVSNYSTIETDGYLSAPLGQGVAASIAVNFRNQDKGYFHNDFLGNDVGKDESFSVRSKWLFTLSEATSITLAADYAKSHQTVGAAASNYPGSIPAASLPPANGQFTDRPRHITTFFNPRFNVKTYGGSATLRSDIGFADLVSITSYRRTVLHETLSGNGTSADGAAAVTTPEIGTVALASLYYTVRQNTPYFATQELQILSKDNGKLKWILGAFGQLSKDEYAPLRVGFTFGQPILYQLSSTKTKALGLYGQATYELTPAFSLTGGLRYNLEHRSAAGSLFLSPTPVGAPAAVMSKGKTFRGISYHASAQYRFSPELMVYASTSKGFKSGVFNITNVDASPAVKPETLYAYEAGFKSNPAGIARINGSVYYYKYKSLQQQVSQSNGLVALENAGGADLQGAELEGELRPMRGLTLRSGISYEHSKYTKFANASVFANAPGGGFLALSEDVSGNPLVRAPKLTFNAGGTLDVPLPENFGKLSLNGNLYHTSRFPWEPGNRYRQDGYTTIDASLGWTDESSNFRANLWVRNLTDKVYYQGSLPSQRFIWVSNAPPRTFGLTLGFTY
ncbi:TonB-dependent receptor (plasmid) [Sphingomonas paeninsulae]|uniref:TonB-dependent receptor n=1 Tax=Sphingomonas paeninsulae TaxID=2319844 RepID=A0A494TBX9_SPHPE|nr:TonB-dependent receptor [Sphingomonas paeninsulae]AYJ84912.1 TonB-dependent receptor [Sphingomonas paeninsulae]